MPTILGEWGELFAALAAFVLSHAVPARPPIRGRLILLLGRRVYLVGYSGLSILILGWLISASARAPYLELWPREDWQTLVPVAGMLVATILGVFGLTSPNPLSIGSRQPQTFDPERPGVVGVVRHPVLWATLLWSATHVVPNGDLAHLMLFGLFGGLSLGGMVMLDRRKQQALGRDAWARLAAKTSNLPLSGLANGWRPSLDGQTALRLTGGIVAYLALIAAHGVIAGIPLLPA